MGPWRIFKTMVHSVQELWRRRRRRLRQRMAGRRRSCLHVGRLRAERHDDNGGGDVGRDAASGGRKRADRLFGHPVRLLVVGCECGETVLTRAARQERKTGGGPQWKLAAFTRAPKTKS